MKKLTITEQKQELTNAAKEMFAKGKTTEFVIEALKNRVYNSGFDNKINVDAIQYLAKQK